MGKRRIRTLAVGLCRHGGRVFVEPGVDHSRNHHFYRAIGGGIDFGERAIDAVAREWREEFAFELADLTLVGVVENIFTYEGEEGHEIVFVYDGRIATQRAYEADRVETLDTEGEPHTGEWVSIDELKSGARPLYPTGALDLIERRQSRAVERG
jgi:ADP-ribose pyrophosphatase YjhB (NUDIX family)